MAKKITKYNIRSGWPNSIKEDCDYFKITYAELAKEADISRYRVSSIANSAILYKSRDGKMEDLSKLTKAFNKIIADRNRCTPMPWVW